MHVLGPGNHLQRCMKAMPALVKRHVLQWSWWHSSQWPNTTSDPVMLRTWLAFVAGSWEVTCYQRHFHRDRSVCYSWAPHPTNLRVEVMTQWAQRPHQKASLCDRKADALTGDTPPRQEVLSLILWQGLNQSWQCDDATVKSWTVKPRWVFVVGNETSACQEWGAFGKHGSFIWGPCRPHLMHFFIWLILIRILCNKPSSLCKTFSSYVSHSRKSSTLRKLSTLELVRSTEALGLTDHVPAIWRVCEIWSDLGQSLI